MKGLTNEIHTETLTKARVVFGSDTLHILLPAVMRKEKRLRRVHVLRYGHVCDSEISAENRQRKTA